MSIDPDELKISRKKSQQRIEEIQKYMEEQDAQEIQDAEGKLGSHLVKRGDSEESISKSILGSIESAGSIYQSHNKGTKKTVGESHEVKEGRSIPKGTFGNDIRGKSGRISGRLLFRLNDRWGSVRKETDEEYNKRMGSNNKI